MNMRSYDMTGIPRVVKPKEKHYLFNYILGAAIILLILWWLLK